jgi:hypothetical protein
LKNSNLSSILYSFSFWSFFSIFLFTYLDFLRPFLDHLIENDYILLYILFFHCISEWNVKFLYFFTMLIQISGLSGILLIFVCWFYTVALLKIFIQIMDKFSGCFLVYIIVFLYKVFSWPKSLLTNNKFWW